MSKDLGDFQTPPALVKAILNWLQNRGKNWTRVLEPTCGQGNFIAGVVEVATPPLEVQGIEIQPLYIEKANNLFQQATGSRVTITQANLFDLNLEYDLTWAEKGPLLVIGNPPWITNTELSTLKSSNLPKKTNLKNLTGFEAMTGSSNFDIAEFIWLKLLREFANEQAIIALLCKTIVARNVLQFAANTKLPIGNAAIVNINAKKWFGVDADACLFYLEINPNEQSYQAQIYDNLDSFVSTSTIGFIGGQLVSNVQRSAVLDSLDGTSPVMWRQGIKHDAAPVAELIIDSSGQLHNKLGQTVNVESEYVYPLLKGSDLGGKSKIKPKRAVIVPQRKIGEDTAQLTYKAPLLWAYLNANRGMFEQRKSSIYDKQPDFAFFGIGEYSFAPFKVAISGFHKTPIFRVVISIEDKAVMLDDTCYFLPCNSYTQALLIASLLNSPLCLELINSITFWDAKRPITKKLLQRIDLLALLKQEKREDLMTRIGFELIRLQDFTVSKATLSTIQSLSLSDLEGLISGQLLETTHIRKPVLQTI